MDPAAVAVALGCLGGATLAVGFGVNFGCGTFVAYTTRPTLLVIVETVCSGCVASCGVLSWYVRELKMERHMVDDFAGCCDVREKLS